MFEELQIQVLSGLMVGRGWSGFNLSAQRVTVLENTFVKPQEPAQALPELQ